MKQDKQETFRQVKVSIDGDPNNTVVTAYTDKSRWNGWLNVYLDLENLTAWLLESPYDYRVLDNGDVRVYIEPEETLQRTSIEVNGSFIAVYDMNGYCFDEIE